MTGFRFLKLVDEIGWQGALAGMFFCFAMLVLFILITDKGCDE